MKCPYCGHDMKDIPPTYSLEISLRQRRIYYAVLKSGLDGIKPKDLLPHMYEPGKNPSRTGAAVMRVVINDLNKSLKNIHQKIKGSRHRGYHIISIEQGL